MKKCFCIKLLFAMAALVSGVVFGVIGASSVYATESSLSINTDTNTAILDILPTSSAGNFASSNDITVSVKTTNYTGYKLSITASSSTNLVNSSENTNLTTIGSAITEDTFSSSSSYNNMWGYKPSKYYDSTSTEFVTNTGDNAVYLPSPSTSTGDIIDETSVANNVDNNYTISIGARADLTTKVGAYTNTFVLTAIANAIPYTITYNMNGGSNGPANENTATYASSVNISSTVPTKTNYTFLGWCAGTSSSSNITTTAGVDSCSSTIYNPNGGGTNLSLNIDQTSSSNDTYLYAMWSLTSYTVTVNFAGSGVASVSFTNATYGNATTVSTSGGTTSLKHGVSYTITMNFSSSSYTINSWATTANGTLGSTSANPTTYTVTNTATLTATGKSSKLYMQDLTLANCPTTETVVYDKRDETPYRVQKLADNKCWMLDNLALDLTALTQAQLYGTGDNAGKMTNASNEALGYLKGATTGTSSDQWAMAAVKKTWTSSYSYSQPWIAVDSTTSGGCNNAYCVDGGAAGSPWSYDSETSETINGVTSIVQGKIGVYYNYCAASAGSYCWGGTGTSSTGSPSSDPVADSIRDITDDICPYKWRLPTGGSTGEFQNLYSQYSGGSPSQVAAFQTALSTPLSGSFYSGTARYQGNYGYFWSSTWYGTNNMYRLYVSSSNVYPSNSGSRYYGSSVRCILAE